MSKKDWYKCKFCSAKEGLFYYYDGSSIEGEIVCAPCADEKGYRRPPKVTRAMSGEILEVSDEAE